MTDDTLHWESATDGLTADYATIDAGLDRANLAAADLAAVAPLGCLARDAAGTIVAGGIARTWGRCCEVQQMWVADEHRRRGLGRAVLDRLESDASARGCDVVFLETFSFQAPDFYRACGYTVAWSRDGFPGGVTKFILQKSLAASR